MMMKAFKKILPINKRGVFFVFISLIILLIGIVNSDLAALFWSSSILTILTLTFIANHIAVFVIKSKLQYFNLKVPVAPLFPEEDITIQLETELPKIFIPGIIVIFSISFNWEKRKPLIFSQILRTGKNTSSLTSRVGKRGYYSSGGFNLFISDYFGFFKSAINLLIDEKISVFPKQINVYEKLNSFKGIDSIEYLKKLEITDEFYEVRKYYPGDDPKKLNWKVFAHTNELFIRKEEETPPPKSNILFIIDLYKTKLIDEEYADEYLDRLIELANSIILLFLKDNLSAMVYIPGYGNIHTINSPNELLILLSKVYWQNKITQYYLPSVNDKFNTILFSTTGSHMLNNLLKDINKKKWSINLYFKLLDAPAIQQKLLTIKNLFFYNNTVVNSQNIQYSNLINKKIVNEIYKYKRAPWNIENVKAI